LADGTRPRLRGSFVVYVPSATGQLTAVSRLRPFICNLDLCSAPHSKSARRLLPATEYYICARARLQAQFIHHRSHISRSSILSQLDLLLLLRSLLLRRRSAQLSSAQLKPSVRQPCNHLLLCNCKSLDSSSFFCIITLRAQLLVPCVLGELCMELWCSGKTAAVTRVTGWGGDFLW
jgi:hypothetical protein